MFSREKLELELLEPPGVMTGLAPPEAEAEPAVDVTIGGTDPRLELDMEGGPLPVMCKGPVGALAGPLGPVALAVLVVLMLLPAGEGRLL